MPIFIIKNYICGKTNYQVILISMGNILIVVLGIVIVALNYQIRTVEPPRDMHSVILPGDRIVGWRFGAEYAVITVICLILMFVLGM